MDNGESKKDFLGKLEGQMRGIKGGDGLTDEERRAGVTEEHKTAIKDTVGELMREQNPKGLPLIYKTGNVIRAPNDLHIIGEDWKVESFNESGFVVLRKKAPSQPGDDERPGMGRYLEKTLTFKEFYKFNPPDETCQNAEYLKEYRKPE